MARIIVRPQGLISPSSQIIGVGAGGFRDEFTGSSLNTDIWLPYDRDGDRVNGDPNVVRPDHIIVSGGQCGILNTYSAGAYVGTDAFEADITRDYASGQMATRGSWLYGDFEASIRTAGGAGTGALFWMLGDAWKPLISSPRRASCYS